MDAANRIESAITGVLKPRGFRKRRHNWFRLTPATEYQVVNLQKSSWGGGNCYLNLGWDPTVSPNEFRPHYKCALYLRAEETDVISPLERIRPDGVTTLKLPGIRLLDNEIGGRTPEHVFARELTDNIVIPIADFLDRTPSIVDLVPLLSAKPSRASVDLRDELGRRGYHLPT